MGLFKKVETDVLADIKQGKADVLGWFHAAVEQLEGVVEDAQGVVADEEAQANRHLSRKAEAEQIVAEASTAAANFKNLLTPAG